MAFFPALYWRTILNLQVIYGDTDSIMIHTGLDDVEKAKSIAVKVAQEVVWFYLNLFDDDVE